MLITEMRMKRIVNSETKLVGTVTITLDEMIAVHDIKVLNNGDRLFLGMPSHLTRANTFSDIVHPINSDVREVLERLIFDAYGIAQSMECDWMQLQLKEEYKNSNFYDLKIEDYDIGKVVPPVAE